MIFEELVEFYEDHEDGPFYASIFKSYPLKDQLKVVPVLKARLDRTADVDRRRRQPEALKLKHRRRQREMFAAMRERNDRRRQQFFNESLDSLRGLSWRLPGLRET